MRVRFLRYVDLICVASVAMSRDAAAKSGRATGLVFGVQEDDGLGFGGTSFTYRADSLRRLEFD